MSTISREQEFALGMTTMPQDRETYTPFAIIDAFLSILYFVGLMLQQATDGVAAASSGGGASGSTDMRGNDDVTWHSDTQDTRITTAENLAGYMKLYQTLLHDTIPKIYRSVTSGGTGHGRGRYTQVGTACISALEESYCWLDFWQAA